MDTSWSDFAINPREHYWRFCPCILLFNGVAMSNRSLSCLDTRRLLRLMSCRTYLPRQLFKSPRRQMYHFRRSVFIPRKQNCCTIHFSSLLTPPATFLGLLVTLWVYKSLMLVIFQNKIIYMPSVPPFSRSEKIEDYAALCRPVGWREERIRAVDGTQLLLAIGELDQTTKELSPATRGVVGERRKRVVILYFQG